MRYALCVELCERIEGMETRAWSEQGSSSKGGHCRLGENALSESRAGPGDALSIGGLLRSLPPAAL